MNGVVLVGEMNPYGEDPKMALYNLPRYASGGRLQAILGLSDQQYLAIRRVNLCVGRWDRVRAADRAPEVVEGARVVVMLGRKVCTAYGFRDLEVFTHRELMGRAYVALPHPSGLCRIWNEAHSWDRAREALAAALEATRPADQSPGP